jgi:hypothetical protein
MGSCLLTYTLTITAARFILPLEPLMLCWAALALVEVARKLRLIGDDADAGPEAQPA